MVSATKSPYSDSQISAWLRGLLTIAWADGHYDLEEQELIITLTKDLAVTDDLGIFKSITPEELANELKQDAKIGENFLRTAVLVAVADGIYSTPEAEILQKFTNALGLEIEALKSLEHTLYTPEEVKSFASGKKIEHPHPHHLHPIKDWLDGMEIHDPRLAKFICKMIPPQCPFERDVILFGHKIVHIPPLCKLNPLYEQLIGLRFRSLSYLADDCGEDITEYIT